MYGIVLLEQINRLSTLIEIAIQKSMRILL